MWGRWLPGDPLNTLNGGTTVSGGSMVLSSIRQQSLSMHERDYNDSNT